MVEAVGTTAAATVAEAKSDAVVTVAETIATEAAGEEAEMIAVVDAMGSASDKPALNAGVTRRGAQNQQRVGPTF